MLLRPPDITADAVRLEVSWSGLDRTVQLLAALAVDGLGSTALAPTPGGSVVLSVRGPSGTGAVPEVVGATAGAVTVGIDRDQIAEAVDRLASIGAGKAPVNSAAIPVRIASDGAERSGVLVVSAPPSARPSRAPLRTGTGSQGLPHPVLRADTWSRTGCSLRTRLRWPEAYEWAELLSNTRTGSESYSVVDDEWRHFTLELIASSRRAHIETRGAGTKCVLTTQGTESLAGFLQDGIERAAFPVDHLDLSTDAGGYFTVIVPFRGES